jgi:hypothetical protein
MTGEMVGVTYTSYKSNVTTSDIVFYDDLMCGSPAPPGARHETGTMTMAGLNYKHLMYVWMIAKTGSIARASEQLHPRPNQSAVN